MLFLEESTPLPLLLSLLLSLASPAAVAAAWALLRVCGGSWDPLPRPRWRKETRTSRASMLVDGEAESSWLGLCGGRGCLWVSDGCVGIAVRFPGRGGGSACVSECDAEVRGCQMESPAEC